MKRVFCTLLSIVIMMSFLSCRKEPEENLDSSSPVDAGQIFSNLNTVYELLNEYSLGFEKIYEYSRDDKCSIDEDSELETFVDAGGVELEYIQDAIAKLQDENANYIVVNNLVGAYSSDFYKPKDVNWRTLQQKNSSCDFSELCISVLDKAYGLRGDFAQVNDLLITISSDLDRMTEDDPEYENYSQLMEYFNIVSAFYELCKTHSNNYGNDIESFTNYRNEVRYIYSGLNYKLQ